MLYFLNINKPKGITSFDVIYKLRKILGIKKIGHAGTLDPLACGVMQVGIADAAKLLDYLGSDKEYIAQLKFGYISSTLDNEGEKTFVSKPNFSIEQLQNTLNKFKGEIEQIPPKYSAIKINGKKLCDLARKGKDLPEIPKRKINIYSTELNYFNGSDGAAIKVCCSKGTYIRTLADDLGKMLGCGAYLESLIRTKAGNFNIEDAVSLDETNIQKYFLDPLDVLEYEKIFLNENEFQKIINGNSITADSFSKTDKTVLLVHKEKLVSIASLSGNIIRVKKVFNQKDGVTV